MPVWHCKCRPHANVCTLPIQQVRTLKNNLSTKTFLVFRQTKFHTHFLGPAAHCVENFLPLLQLFPLDKLFKSNLGFWSLPSPPSRPHFHLLGYNTFPSNFTKYFYTCTYYDNNLNEFLVYVFLGYCCTLVQIFLAFILFLDFVQ